METLHFPTKQVKALREQMKKDGADTFLLVHDQGVYMMNPKQTPETKIIVYARGCNPETDDDWYENARQLVGGDDFGENLPANWIDQFYAKRKNHLVFIIKISDTEIKLG